MRCQGSSTTALGAVGTVVVPQGLFRAFPSCWSIVLRSSHRVLGHADRNRRIRWVRPFFLIECRVASLVTVRHTGSFSDPILEGK